MALTERQERFAHEYAARGVARDAAIAAGYAPGRGKQTGYELLQHPEVASLVAELAERRGAELELDARHLVSEALEYHRRALAGDFPPAVGVRALDLVARLTGSLAPSRHEERRVTVSMKLGAAE